MNRCGCTGWPKASGRAPGGWRNCLSSWVFRRRSPRGIHTNSLADESIASLDVSVQARVLDLLADLQRDLSLTYLFIGHDLAVIQRMSHDVLVMRDGEAVEYRPADELFDSPEQEYTRALLAAVPPRRPRAALSG